MLRNGDARAAFESFKKIVATNHADASICLGLANPCLSLSDSKELSAALDKALAVEPYNIRALMMKADCLASLGNNRVATTFYLAIVKAATAAIGIESIDVIDGDTGASDFQPSAQARLRRPYNSQSGMLNNPDWGAFHL